MWCKFLRKKLLSSNFSYANLVFPEINKAGGWKLRIFF